MAYPLRPPTNELTIAFQPERSSSGSAFDVKVASPDGESATLTGWRPPVSDWEAMAVGDLLAPEAPVKRGIANESRDPVRDVGARLFTSVFTGRGAALFRRATDNGSGVRIRIRAGDPRVTALPWELLLDPERRDFLVLLPESSVVRQNDLIQAEDRPPLEHPPLRIKVVTAQPPGMAWMDLERDVQIIQGIGEETGMLEVEVVTNVDTPALHKVLNAGSEFDVLHFAGTGLESPDGGEQHLAMSRGDESLDPHTFVSLVSQHRRLRAVVLGACHSDLLAARVATTVPCAVGIRGEISVAGCLAFSSGFYRALAAGHSVDVASGKGRRESDRMLPGRREWGSIILHLTGVGRMLDVPRDSESARRTLTPSRTRSGGVPLPRGAPAPSVRQLRRDVVARNLHALTQQAEQFGEATPSLIRDQIAALRDEMSSLGAEGSERSTCLARGRNPRGRNPRGPNPRGPNPHGPNPHGPNPHGPNPHGRRQPAARPLGRGPVLRVTSSDSRS